MLFGELKKGEKFIAKPVRGDSYESFYIFLKIGKKKAVNLVNGIVSDMPETMEVTKVRG